MVVVVSVMVGLAVVGFAVYWGCIGGVSGCIGGVLGVYWGWWDRRWCGGGIGGSGIGGDGGGGEEKCRPTV